MIKLKLTYQWGSGIRFQKILILKKIEIFRSIHFTLLTLYTRCNQASRWITLYTPALKIVSFSPTTRKSSTIAIMNPRNVAVMFFDLQILWMIMSCFSSPKSLVRGPGMLLLCSCRLYLEIVTSPNILQTKLLGA